MPPLVETPDGANAPALSRRQCLTRLAAAGALAARPWAAQAALPQELKFLVPAPASGGPDVVVRTLAQEIERAQGVNVVVQNHGGANGELGIKRFFNAPVDGSTWFLSWDSVVVLNPLFYPREHAEVLHGLQPVAVVANTATFYLVVGPQDPVQTFDDFLREGRAGASMPYGTAGVGSLFHVMTEDMAQRLSLKVRHIPYRGNAQALGDLMSGQLRFVMAGTSVLPLIQSGKLRAIAVTSLQRQPAFPQLPAISEYLPQFEVSSWYGLFGPRGVSPEHLSQMGAWVDAAVRSDIYRNNLSARGDFAIRYLAGDAFTRYIERQHRQLSATVARMPKEIDANVR
jgi:tripartite-type tricarboxylate transporter receptor subunit TctC